VVFIFDFALDRALAYNIVFSAKGGLRHGVRPPLKNILLWFGCYRQHIAFSLEQGAYRRVRYYASESDMIPIGEKRDVSSIPMARTSPRGGTSLIAVSRLQAIE